MTWFKGLKKGLRKESFLFLDFSSLAYAKPGDSEIDNPEEYL